MSMDEEEKPIIYYLDDTEEGRRDLQMQLRSLFEADFKVLEMPLSQAVEEYTKLLADQPIAGIFIDQNLDETGEIAGYTGVKLVGYLRAIFTKLPIYLVTGHLIQGELESEEAGDADLVVSKGELVTDSPTSLRFRRQFLRRVEQYEKALRDTQLRFRGLLSKKFGEGLSPEEKSEYDALRVTREIATDEAEGQSAKAVNDQIDKIADLLRRVDQIKERTSE